ncbi:MAG: polysaccharide lyase family 1 protein [Gammaproteobacteria bacterium]
MKLHPTILATACALLVSQAYAADIDARTLTGASTPLLLGSYGTRTYSAPVKDDNGHAPANYKAAPKLPTWQFAQVDPTGGVLTFERQTAPQNGWHTISRAGKVVVTGGSAAASDRVYTVFNGQQLVAALKQAGNEPKIVRIVGHIDLRWSNNNTVFKEYTSYLDQKQGGSIMIPSNTTLVGINDAQGRPARITGTTLLIGAEAPLAAGGDPQADFKSWVSSGKNPEDYPTWTRNVIIRNLQIDTPWDVNPEDSANAYADGVTLSRAQNVWIDHVSISDGDTPDSLASDTRHDGALDIVRGSDYITVANSYFTKHHKQTLVGNGDSGRAWSDEGRLHVTFSGNWWDSLGSRLPLVRFGQVHVFNNLITGSTTTKDDDLKFESGLDARYKSSILVQNNYYSFTGLKPKEFCGKVIKGKGYTGFRSSGHLFISDKADGAAWSGPAISITGQCGLSTASGAAAWTAPYAFTLQAADAALTSVKSNAGAGKLR